MVAKDLQKSLWLLLVVELACCQLSKSKHQVPEITKNWLTSTFWTKLKGLHRFESLYLLWNFSYLDFCQHHISKRAHQYLCIRSWIRWNHLDQLKCHKLLPICVGVLESLKMKNEKGNSNVFFIWLIYLWNQLQSMADLKVTAKTLHQE